MTVDDFTKLLLAFAVAFAIIIIAWGLFKLLNTLASSVEDFRKAIKNTSDLSDLLVEDYAKAREEVYSAVQGFKDFKASFVDPVRNIGKIASFVAPLVARKKKGRED
ncbi:hypothetical protein BROC_01804 [Candidatus Brocadiaceae bacterium]|nr:hypothetical protein [Candidatus Dojkabacteria bacterium]CAG0942264.1 hypothetical protein BROC_01804 [Candidatus Brocadiaceae bacterium]